MLQRIILTVTICFLLAPHLMSCWPQRRTRQEPSSTQGTPLCNITFVADVRSNRPPFPDPRAEGDDTMKERDDRVIFPGQSKNPPSKINFPDATTELMTRVGIQNGNGQSFLPVVPSSDRGPSCAEGSTFCEVSDNYPGEHVAQLLKNDVNYIKEYFGEETPMEINITQRIDASDEAPLCPSHEQVVYPKMALNKEDKWLFIVNQDQLVQGVRVEKCIKEGPCALTETLPIGYKTSCRQKYIYRKLLSLNEDGKAVSDSFRIPSCCACYFRMTSIGSRFGSGQPMSPARGRGSSPIASKPTVQTLQQNNNSQIPSPNAENLSNKPVNGAPTPQPPKITSTTRPVNSSTSQAANRGTKRREGKAK